MSKKHVLLGQDPKQCLALAIYVPQQAIVLQYDSFLVSVPEFEYLDMDHVACTICGGAPYSGQDLLGRDNDSTCQRRSAAYSCKLCRWEPLPGYRVRLACIESEAEDMLTDKRRLASLKRFWELQDARDEARRRQQATAMSV